MTGPNIWPDLPGWKDTVAGYYDASAMPVAPILVVASASASAGWPLHVAHERSGVASLAAAVWQESGPCHELEDRAPVVLL